MLIALQVETQYHPPMSPHSWYHLSPAQDPSVLSPKRVPLKAVRHVACGCSHTVAVTDDAVYSWGHGACGALGHGSYEDKVGGALGHYSHYKVHGLPSCSAFNITCVTVIENPEGVNMRPCWLLAVNG